MFEYDEVMQTTGKLEAQLAGRPSTHRRASSIDAFRTGAKPKKPKPEPLSQEKENLEEGNYYGETEEQLDMWTTEDPL